MTKNKVYPSRYLNDQRAFFGLWMTDFAFAIMLFSLWSKIFEETVLASLGILIALGSLIFLSPIRLKTRRKIIRDFLAFHISKRRLYDPR